MHGFERNYTQVDIPTLELVPQDEAEREDWHRRRRIAEANRRILREDAELRMAAMERYNEDSRSPLRKILSRIAVWIGFYLVLLALPKGAHGQLGETGNGVLADW